MQRRRTALQELHFSYLGKVPAGTAGTPPWPPARFFDLVMEAEKLVGASDKPRGGGAEVAPCAALLLKEGSLQGRLESEPVGSTDRDRGTRVRG